MRKQDGFMTVELIVALIVGAVLIFSLHGIVTSQTFLTQRGRDLIVANAYAERKIESLRSAGYLGVNLGTTNITSELPDELKAPRSASLNVSSHSTGIKRVHLTIAYNEQGVSRTQSYTTYVGELGVGQ